MVLHSNLLAAAVSAKFIATLLELPLTAHPRGHVRIAEQMPSIPHPSNDAQSVAGAQCPAVLCPLFFLTASL
jgi:hypothetical protein